MAPSRRKGSNKAAAAAAARRKWKVGDLVLAKVKGFPAWPATVSEPEKWGYPADRKKVVVQFFGCEQILLYDTATNFDDELELPGPTHFIMQFLSEVAWFNDSAFCNPVDIEEFTEEKKASLLGKRHGKGADFVRAVNEIIDCFEKLKKQDQVSRDNGTAETRITDENNSQESLTAPMKDEAPVVTVNPLSAGTTNDLDSLTEAAVAAATEDAFQNEDDMQVAEAPSNLVFTETSVSATYLTRNKTDVTRSRNGGSQRRKPARRLRSSSRIDASRLRSTVLPSINHNNRTSRRLRASASEDRSLRRSRRIIKSSDDSEGQDVDSLAFVANDCIEESDTGVMSVDSDTLSIDDGSTVDSVCKPGGAERPFAENNGCQTELSDRLDFQSNNVVKKKRKPSRKRPNNDIVEAAKPDIIASDAEELKTECVSPSFSEKSTQKHAKDGGDEHLPLVKRARVRMGRPSPAADEELDLVHNEEKTSEVPESHSVQSSEPLSCKVDALPSNREPILNKEEPTLSSLSHVSPANKPSFMETRKNFVDGEAALPPSKRLHRALEAMSANVAEDCQRASNCSPAANSQSNGCCASFSLECSERKKTVIELGSGAVKDLFLHNGDSLLSASEFCGVSNVERSENIAVVSDCGKTSSSDGNDPEVCTGSSELAEGADTKSKKMCPFVEVPAVIDAIPVDRLKLGTVNAGEQLAYLNCNSSGLLMSPADQCKTGCTDFNEAAKGFDPDSLQIHSDSTSVQDIADGSPNIDACNQHKSSDGEGDKAHKAKDLLSAENNQDSKMSEFVEEAKPASLNSKIMHPVTPVKVLNNGHHRPLIHSTSVSNDNMEDRTVSITQSSSSLTDGPDSVARASPPSSSVCNISALDNNKSLGNNSSCYPDVHLHLEKAKLAGKSSSSKGEALSSFEAIIKSLTRTKESIGRATRIAIDCAKFGFATKVVEILAHNLESESSLHKKVDLFFLVDSITQCSRGDGGVYPSAIQALLPRLLLAAAPPSSSTHENHRQCLKVLKVWQERKILPEPIIRHHIRELDSLCGSYPTMSSNRSLRNERAFDDPIREMEGMQVDEYGSNSSIQLPGFCMPPMLRDDDVRSDSDGESFEAVTPEHNGVDNLDGEMTLIPPAVEKRRHILEDVDGELEMEDVAPCCEDEITSTSNFVGVDQSQMLHQQCDNNNGHQPKGSPLIPPQPPPHPIPPSGFPPAVLNSVSNGPDSKPYSTSQILKLRFLDICPTLVALVLAIDLIHPGFLVELRLTISQTMLTARVFICALLTLLRQISPCYPDGPRMVNPPMTYGGPPREPPLPHNRWNFPLRPVNNRHFNPYRPPSEGPIPVANRGPNYWRPR
ncbi:hua2-like protein 2 [Phtheirospermum japonicum]|uniref:Hua2-like protein 2 n=1 Tax=Phtheirospermum japonicum TaxID=374723 RepID=A0A830CU46_9LAMI|nr:hua2-like protein 2 [Phtheirospermum japonicum]